MKLFRKAGDKLADRSGVALVEYLFGAIIIVIFAAIILAVIAAGNTRVTLESFADELATRVGMLGKCDDPEIDEMYRHLCEATGLTPEYEISADEYINPRGRTVQYGEPIYLTLTLHVDKIGFGDFAIPFDRPMVSKKITQSEQYWKDGEGGI